MHSDLLLYLKAGQLTGVKVPIEIVAYNLNRNIMKQSFLLLLLSFLCFRGFAQTDPPNINNYGSPDEAWINEGALQVNKALILPKEANSAAYTSLDSLGRLRSGNDSLPQFHNGNHWLNLMSDTFQENNVTYPPNLTFRPFNIYEKSGRYFTDLAAKDLVKEKISRMLPYYVNCETGSDSNNGLTETTPFATISAAYAAGARLIYVAAGICKNNSWGVLNDSFANTDDLFIIGTGKTYITSAYNGTITYTLQTGTTYKATITSAISAVDMRYRNGYGDPLRLAVKTSVTQVDATPGSYYRSGNDIYVNLLDGTAPGSSLLILTRNKNASYKSNAGYHYVSDITFMGGGLITGTHGVESQEAVGSTLVSLAYGCKFLYGEHNSYDANGGEGSRNQFNLVTWSENCVSYGNARDGFNYLSDVTNPMNFIEINCQSFNNGEKRSSSSVNATSSHNISFGIRIEGKYYRNSGPNVADVHGCIAAHFGCNVFESISPTAGDNYDFKVWSINVPTYHYIYGCTSGNPGAFRVNDVDYAMPSYMIIDPNVNYVGKAVSTHPDYIVFEHYATAPAPMFNWPALSAYTAGPLPITSVKTLGGQSLVGSGNVTEVQNSLATSTLLAPSAAAVNGGLATKANLAGGNTISGSQGITGTVTITNTSLQPLRATYTGVALSSHRGIAKIQATSTGNMVDGYGPEIGYYIRDTANVDNIIGSIGTERYGADNTGKMYFNAYNSGVEFKFLDGAYNGANFYVPLTATQFKLSALNTAPSSATDTGTLGEIRYDANYMYVCVATNTWKRTALSSW
jgi:hypothetical protein